MTNLKKGALLLTVLALFASNVQPALAFSNPLRVKQHRHAKHIEKTHGITFLMPSNPAPAATSSLETIEKTPALECHNEKPDCTSSDKVTEAK